jgi:formylglycine-generating enzyme required for sulfatase activity
LADEEGATLAQNPLLATSRLARAIAVSALVSHGGSSTAHATVTMDWVPVGNPGNAPDTATNCLGGGCGAVAYNYYISKYDVTNAQYADFLNAVDPSGSNTLGLFSSGMSTDASNGGITNTGSAGSVYQVKPGFANDPVTYVSFYDALRFANWLNNGQGIGSTETGAYMLLGGTAIPSNGTTVVRNPGGNIFLPSENEWYKAAFYNPATSSYFAYPGGSNTPPVCAAPGATPNTANCGNVVGHPTPVGAYTSSASTYGTFDQGGNVFQWDEQIVDGGPGLGLERNIRGGFWEGPVPSKFILYADVPTDESPSIGFRVASLVPEPGTGLLVMAGVLGLAVARRTRT